MYNCPRCKKLVTLEHRVHVCKNVMVLHGKPRDGVVFYNPNIAKPNKQSTQAGYMKFFGSTAAK